MSRSSLRIETLPGGRLARPPKRGAAAEEAAAAQAAATAAAERAKAAAKKHGTTKAQAAAAAKAASKGAGEIRIIGGQWKRTRLAVAQRPGLRPTPDRVRETLFNWLGQDLHGWRCVDAFAGTGALGFEAASRGAASVQLVEADAGLIAQLGKIKDKLEALAVRVQRGDGVAALQQATPGTLDLVLLDPPFDAPLFEPALKAAAKAISARGFIYLESPELWSDERLAAWGLKTYRFLKAGAVHAHLLQAVGSAAPADESEGAGGSRA